MDNTINERILKITGSSNIENDLGAYGDDVTLIVKGTIDGIEGKPNYDGTINMIYKVKQITAVKANEEQRIEKQV